MPTLKTIHPYPFQGVIREDLILFYAEDENHKRFCIQEVYRDEKGEIIGYSDYISESLTGYPCNNEYIATNQPLE